MATNGISTGYTSYSMSTADPLSYEAWLEQNRADRARYAEEDRIENEFNLAQLRTAFPEWSDRIKNVDQLIYTIARLRLREGDDSTWEAELVDLDAEIDDYDLPTPEGASESDREMPTGVVAYSADFIYVWMATREETAYGAFPRHLSAEPSPTTP